MAEAPGLPGEGADMVGTQAFQVFWDFLEREGVPRAPVEARLRAEGFPPELLARRGAWVHYHALLAVERAVAAACPDRPELFFTIGRSIGETQGLGFLRAASRTLISPHLLYRQMPGMMRRFLFRFVELELRSVSRGRIDGQYRFAPGCAPSDAFLETARGVLSAMPCMLGAPPAEVTLRRTGPLSAEASIRFRPWSGPVHALVTLLAAPWRWLRLRLRAPEEARQELLETNRELMDKVAELDAAKGELADRVHDLEELRGRLADLVSERTAELEAARGELEQTVRRLEQAVAGRTAFFTNVSHELKTPLTLILAPLGELASATQGSPAQLTRVRTAERHAQALLMMVNEILDFARLDAGRMPLRPARLELVGEVSAAASALKPMAEARRARLVLPEGPALTAVVDRTLVLRAVVNLVVNALKYGNEGGEVRVTVERQGDEARIAVADDGPGIPLAEQAHIFERFGRAADAEGRPVGGAGLGLAMVAEIAALHGGGVRLESAPGEGARFTLTLPLSGAALGVQQPQSLPVVGATEAALPPGLTGPLAALPGPAHGPFATTPPMGEPATGPRARVLVVDDNAELRAYLAGVIGQRHEVLTAADGREALAVVRERRPDLVLSDVMMPVMDGHALCRALKSDPETAAIPVVLITARHGDDAVIGGFGADADDFVRKPFSTPALLARLDTHLRLVQLRRQLLRSERVRQLGALSSGLAHEVLNPVNALLQSVRLLQDPEMGLDEEERGALLGAVARAGRRIETIVRAVQRFAQQGEQRVQWQPVTLSALMTELRPLLEHRLVGKAQLHVVLGDDPVFHGEPALLQQVLSNLVLNGLEAGEQVWVRAAREGARVTIEVCDDGPGVPEELREWIFDPFHTTRAPGSGTGLGLAIAREITELHRGTLTLAPPDVPAQPGGARFIWSLPAEVPRDDDAEHR